MMILLNKIKNKIYSTIKIFHVLKENNIAKTISSNSGRPIYHVHIPKTAGTTINFAFLSNSNQHSEIFYESIALKENHRQISNNKVFVGWNTKLINEGNFSYAFSHKPLHQLDLPKMAFVFTCFRDPCKRVISYYNMLKYFKVNNINHSCMKTLGMYVEKDFEYFINTLPSEYLMNQFYMFSKEFDLEEAKININKLDQVIYTEKLDIGLKTLELNTGWKLPISNQKNFGYKEDLKPELLNILREKLNPEYELLESINR